MEYYRYLRFFENGLVVSYLTNYRISKKDANSVLTMANFPSFLQDPHSQAEGPLLETGISDYRFTAKEISIRDANLSGDPSVKKKWSGNLLLGEYLVLKNKVYLKLFDNTYINEFVLNIEEGDNFGMSP